MSEYQYYEFRALDQPLDDSQMRELRRLSTRAEITSTSFTNMYNYGDFKGDLRKLVESYFDAFVYIVNWGTHQLMLSIPRQLLDIKAASLYRAGEGLTIRRCGPRVIIEFDSRDEGAAWGQVDSLVAARKQKEYGQAVALLRDLKIVAKSNGTGRRAILRLKKLRRTHEKKSTFIERLDAAGL